MKKTKEDKNYFTVKLKATRIVTFSRPQKDMKSIENIYDMIIHQ